MDFGPIDASGDQSEEFKRCLWIGNAAWRLTKHNTFMVGSSNNTEKIDQQILKLLGTRILSIEAINQFMDIKVLFDNGLELTTFFYWPVEDQWVLFRPNHSFGIDFSTQEERLSICESLKNVRFPNDNFKKPYKFSNLVILKIINLDNGVLKIFFQNRKKLVLDKSCWRLEKNLLYIAGTMIDNEVELQKLNLLLGKKVISSFISDDGFDLMLHMEDGYILKTFKCAYAEDS
jgi:hypothetical protein